MCGAVLSLPQYASWSGGQLGGAQGQLYLYLLVRNVNKLLNL